MFLDPDKPEGYDEPYSQQTRISKYIYPVDVTCISGLRVCDIYERDAPLVPAHADQISRIFKDMTET